MEVTDPIVKVERGQAAILDCPPIKSYPPPMVQWLTDDGTQLYDIKYASVAETHQLVVLSASDSDQKAYRSIEKEIHLNELIICSFSFIFYSNEVVRANYGFFNSI